MKCKKGFSLLEAVVSIAALTLLSGFIIQMFISSMRLNQKAYNLDMAANAAIKALEWAKAGQPQGAGGGKYFDGDWNEVGPGMPGPGGARFVLQLETFKEAWHEQNSPSSFGPGWVGAAAETPTLYKISAGVYEIKANGAREEIVSLSTSKYWRSG